MSSSSDTYKASMGLLKVNEIVLSKMTTEYYLAVKNKLTLFSHLSFYTL